MNFDKFFKQACGKQSDENFGPYDYQKKLAEEPWPDLLEVPTGMGKTAAVILAWLYKRHDSKNPQCSQTPRRLVYCLPMRVLVEQTYENTIRWLDRLGKLAGTVEWNQPESKQRLEEYIPDPEIDGVSVHLLLGGAEKTDWITWPEREAILIGTQDMLLSRALNRGYATGRARWPMDFAMLNNDCLWVFDEVQLMSTGLATSLQLDAWRKILHLRCDDGFLKETEKPVAQLCQSLWMSATMTRHWLDSATDWQPYSEKAWNERITLSEKDKKQNRINNQKNINNKNPITILAKPTTTDKKGISDIEKSYISDLSQEVIKYSSEHGLTLVVLNTVDRSTALYESIKKDKDNIYLIHSRYRPWERKKWKELFEASNQGPRIIIATQVVEAGVDISTSVLFTELAPWPSLVQRFGRCARNPNENGTIYWMDVSTHESNALPYTIEELKSAKNKLQALDNASLHRLMKIKEELDKPVNKLESQKLFPYEPRFVPREKDLFDLFDTTPDLTGADIDISRFIRDGREVDVQVFWRNIETGQSPSKRDKPHRDELCPVAFYRFREQLRDLLNKGRIWRWNYRKGWEPLTVDQGELIYPGQVFLMDKSCGGYDQLRGWTGNPADQDFEDVLYQKGDRDAETMTEKLDEESENEESQSLSELTGWVKLSDHSLHVCEEMDTIGKALLSDSERNLSKLAARWHDRGKAHSAFVAKFKDPCHAQENTDGEPVAKAPDEAWRRDKIKASEKSSDACPDSIYLRRPGFRHELASALAILETLKQAEPEHPVFSWPDGLNKEDFGCVAIFQENTDINSGVIKELSNLSKQDFNLLLYMVAGHHGKVRMSLRSSPDDARSDVPDPCPSDKRQARGVRDGDILDACTMPDANGNNVIAPEITLNLDPMELGLSCRYGPSWRERMQNLLECLGPFRLAYLETLLRIADWRASRKEDEDAKN
jgi:CRISPR-associated endonuclease/helicase Cas3